MGWFISGNAKDAYQFGARSDPEVTTSFLASKSDPGDGFGTVMQQIQAKELRGHVVRLSAGVASDDVTGWAGLWMGIDGPAGKLGFDNMEDRAIKGTTDWSTYNIELEVQDAAETIGLGFLLAGPGIIRVRDLRLEADGVEVDPASVGLADVGFERLAHRWRTDQPFPDEMRSARIRPSRARRSLATTGWEALTDAEQAVVRLAADGLSNPEIAGRLFISRHTVETHLKHVYAKTGIGSRAQLAAEFVRRTYR